METYKVGNGDQPIKLAVDIDTLGLAASRAIVLIVASTDTGKAVAHSKDATGDIAKKIIGKASELEGKRLSVFTRIDLIGTDEERKREAERTTATYQLEGGIDGNLKFGDSRKIVNDEFTRIFLHKPIDLIG